MTETGLLDTSAVSRENLVRMRNAGVRIALDDFGVGFSCLAHLRDLPIHRLKIDRSFTVECMRDARTLTIVKAVIDMARSLGINITAEGIETQAQQTWMQHLGLRLRAGLSVCASDERRRFRADVHRSPRGRTRAVADALIPQFPPLRSGGGLGRGPHAAVSVSKAASGPPAPLS